MLVLTRRLGEKVVIDEEIVISVERIDANKVRIGIVAPDHVRIVRKELIGREPKNVTQE